MSGNAECFRVRGIPLGYDETKASELLKHVLGLEANAKMRIFSLAPETYPCSEQMATVEIHPRTQQMATVNFETRPPRLSKENGTLEWPVSCGCGKCISSGGKIELTIDSHFRDITVLHWPKDGNWKMDVVAVSGLGGHAFGSFKAKGATEMWLRDYLPQELPGARIITYGHDSHLVGSNSFQSVLDIGFKFRDVLDRIRRHCQGSKIPMVLIGHSLGGIIIKDAILEMLAADHARYDEILASITEILFFGVPNHGMDIGSLLPMVDNQPNEDLLRTLGIGSDLLIRQSTQFLKQFQGKWKGGVDFNRVKIVSFYETQTSPTAQKTNGVWKMNGPHTVLVDKSSATHGRPWEADNKFIRPVDADHSGLVKFASRKDKTYLEVLSLLRG